MMLPILLLTTIGVVEDVMARNGVPGGDQAREDFLNSNGRHKDTSCDPEVYTDAYCTGYKIAYELQWAYMTIQYDCSSGSCR